MFDGTVYLVIESKQFHGDEVEKIKDIIEKNNDEVYIKEEHDNKINFLDNLEKEDEVKIDHIISVSVEFIEYSIAKQTFISVTTPQWVYDSYAERKAANPKLYNPDPRYFMKDVFVCVADNLPQGDKEVIYGGVKAFGGQFLDDLTRYTTHLVAIDMNNDKSIVAASVANLSSQETEDGSKVDIKIVSPYWIDECIKVGRKVDEGPYLLNSSSETFTHYEDMGIHPLVKDKHVLAVESGDCRFFYGKVFYISTDYEISDTLRNAIETLVVSHGGKVAKDFNTEDIDIYICKYRSGNVYLASCLSNRIIVGNLQWFYFVVTTNEWVLPISSNLLYYPIPPQPLPAFEGLKISITNYSGDARYYLSRLISILGGTFTKTLTRENDYLIAASPNGKKFEAATRWSHKDHSVKIVNHFWLEECYTNWCLLDYKKSHYQFFGDGIKSIERLLGKTKLNTELIRESAKQSNGEDNEINSASPYQESNENEDTNTRIGLRKSSEDLANLQEASKLGRETQLKGPLSSEKNDASQMLEKDLKASDTMSDNEPQENNSEIELRHVSEKADKYTEVMNEGRSQRSAKRKAVNKLHVDMSDLNEYQIMAKSSRKMKTFMEDIEKELNNRNGDKKPKLDDTTKKQVPKGDKAEKMNIYAIVTGSENIISLSRHDIHLLNNVGIKVLTDNSSCQLNTLFAPKVLRTAKFLSALSKVTKIIHPKFLLDVLDELHASNETGIEKVLANYSIDVYSLEKMLPKNSLGSELGIDFLDNRTFNNLLVSPNKGKIFSKLRVNLSVNLNGGVQTITKILCDHGLEEARALKNSSSNMGKKVIINHDGKAILIANKEKDPELIKKFKHYVDNAVVVEWDWCVMSIFRMKQEDFKRYTL